MIELGSVVRNKKSGIYGLVNYSIFGYSIHSWFPSEEYGEVRGKTLGMSEDEVLKYYTVIGDVPDGYEIDSDGWIKEIESKE